MKIFQMNKWYNLFEKNICISNGQFYTIIWRIDNARYKIIINLIIISFLIAIHGKGSLDQPFMRQI